MTSPNASHDDFQMYLDRLNAIVQQQQRREDVTEPQDVRKIRESLTVPEGIDPDIVAGMMWFLTTWTDDPRDISAKSTYTQALARGYKEGIYGVRMDLGRNQYMGTMPGGQTLWASGESYGTPILSLDLAFDISDPNLLYLRNSLLYALDELKIVFIPMSMTAHSRTPIRMQTISLIDRDGLNCVFKGKNPSTAKTEYYISGYDVNEDPPLYFLARLPHKVSSHQEGIEALKPTSVKEAEALGLSVIRQGDMFFIPTPYKKEDLVRMDAVIGTKMTITQQAYVGRRPTFRIESWGSKKAVIEEERRTTYTLSTGEVVPINEHGMIEWTEERVRGLYGTAHTADQIAHLPDGTQFAKGCVRHDPSIINEGRSPDHKPLKLPGAKWYLVAKNTVPVQK